MRTHKRLVVLLILMLNFGWMVTSTEAQDEPLMPHVETSNIVIDGVIGSNEYSSVFEESKTGMLVYWEHDGTNMYIGLVSPGMGWSAIAFGPQGTGMDGSNILIGYVEETGVVTLADSIGVGWLHEQDIDRGGQDNIMEQAGTQNAEGTSLEFSFPLNSGDNYDQTFEIGGIYGFFVAYHETNDDFASYHGVRSDILKLRIGIPGELPPSKPETSLILSIPLESLEQHEMFTISAHLTNNNGTAMVGENIKFYLVTTFTPNDIPIGEALTDVNGIAQFEYMHSKSGSIELKAVFEGTSEFAASKDSDTVFIMSVSTIDDSPEIIRIPGTNSEVSLDVIILTLILVFIFGSVYVTYGRIIHSILFQLPKEKDPERELRPRELRFADVDLESRE